MPSLRDEISKTIQRLSRRAAKPSDLAETLVATDLRIGRQYGSYRVLHRLGVGGMGHVYLAIDTRLGRHAALKFLSPKLKTNPDMLARLQQEARTASSLNHPNILTIYDIDEAEGEPFIASEFVEGINLRQALEREAVDRDSILDIAIQICSALKPAHEAGVIHRDLKPGNIMLRPDGLVKVIDFGLAKFIPQGQISPLYEPLSDPGAVAGTVQYMSPEQARGDEMDHRTDLWSLGVLLYEMIAHRKPFDGETESHVIVSILDTNPTPLKTGSGVSHGLVQVVEKALAKNPDKRYQDAAEMLTALKALEVSTQSRPSRVFKSALIKRRKSRRAWIALAGVLLAAASAVWWWPRHGRDVVLGPSWFQPRYATQITNRGDVNMATISPDGKRVAYLTQTGDQNQLHLMSLETRAEFTWPSYEGDTLGFTFSPDNASLFVTVHDKREWGRLFAAKEQVNDLAFVLDNVDGPISFSPDGSEFAFRRRSEEKRENTETLVVAKTSDTGSQRTILSKYNTRVGPRIAWSQSGIIAVNLFKADLTGDARPTVLMLSPDGKALEERQDGRLRRLSGPAWIDSHSMLVFAGFGAAVDESQTMLVELARRTGEFRFFSSRPLNPQSLTSSADFQKLAAVGYQRRSALWVSDARTLDEPVQWSANDSFDSLTWDTDESIVHPSANGGNVALWQARSGGVSHSISTRTDCVSTEPAAVPGTATLVFSSNCDASANASNLWILNRTNGSLKKLTDHSHSDKWPAIALDADTVIYDSWPNNFPNLMKVSLRTKVKSPFTSLQSRHASISPDGTHVACQIRENYDGKWRAAILSMREAVIEKDNLPLPADSDSTVRWSPDGRALDYLNKRDLANVWRMPLDGSPAKALTHLHGSPINDFAWNHTGTRLAWVCSDVRRDVIIFDRGGK